jgi:murein hydrolase activator
MLPHHAVKLVAHPAPVAAEVPSEPMPDLSHALPAGVLNGLPSTADQYRHLRGAIVTGKPALDAALAHADALRAQAAVLQRKLIETAARVQSLEAQKVQLDADIVRLAAEDATLSRSFARDRVSVARLLAVIERLQHDTPPAMVLRPDDALAATRGAMLIGASLPSVYGKAATLSRRLQLLADTRRALVARRAEGVRNAAQLSHARVELDQLLANKKEEVAGATAAYGALRDKLGKIAAEAQNLEALMARVAALRQQPTTNAVVVVTAQNPANRGPVRGSLITPVVGHIQAVGSGAGPGVTYLTAAGAQVVAPADCEVLFAGPYHKSGQVLILEVSTGYDLVLEGLDRIMVRPGDQVLAGEPVGAMPQLGQEGELYFEVRENGRGTNPVPLLIPEIRKEEKT